MSAVELEVGKADFDFYAKFAKPLILSLTNTEDRILASAWFSKLRDEASGPEKLRLDYLKLLLFVLQRHRLAGPFTENPNIEETLQTFGDTYDLPTIARQIIEKEQEEKKERYCKRMRGEIGDFSPYSTDYSPDLREYVAAQDIPNFGVHVYYAISKDPILDWDNAHHAVFPKAVKRMEPQGHLSETSFAIMEPKDVEEDIDKCKILEETGVMPDESIFLGQRRERERKSPYVYMDRPAPALGILPGEGETEVIDEELPPPTWGSNLIEVREPIDMERPDTGAEEPDQPPPKSPMAKEADPEDPDIVELLETSFNMEDILAEVDAIETEDFVIPDGFLTDENDEFAAAEVNFQDVRAMLDQQDAAIAAAMAELDEDELKMLAEMEAEDKEVAEAKKHEPKQEVKVLADDDTVIKLLTEEPGSKKETAEEKDRKAAKKADEKKKKPAGRTGLLKGKAKGALLKQSEKKALEEEEKKAKVAATKTGKPAGGPAKRPGVPKTKPSTSKSEVVETASTGKIPTAKPSDSGIPKSGKGIPRPAGRGIPRPAGRGIPRPAGSGIPRPGERAPPPGETPEPTPAPQSHMEVMKARLEQMMQETRESFPEEFTDEGQADLAAPAQEEAPERARRVRLSPIHEVSLTAPMSPGSPESDDIFDEMDREYLILERLYELYEQIAPDVPDQLRTPPLFSKHREIKALGRQLRYTAKEFDIHPMEQFQPAEQYFAEEGRVAPSPFVDPREAARMGEKGMAEQDVRDVPVRSQVQPAPEATPPRPERVPVEEESPPWAEVEDLKRICERAERRVDISPAIAGGVGVTTPKSPATPRRPAKRDLRFAFDLESPPLYESPPASPEPMTTPEFVRISRYQLPGIISEAELEKAAAERYPEYEAYMKAEIQAERDIWGRFAPGAAPEVVSPGEPKPAKGTPSPRPGPSTQVTPPSAVAERVEPQRTPEQLPPEYQYQYETPPRLAPTERPEIPGSPVFEEFDPLAHEDITLQVAPDLVEADFDEFEQVHGSPQIQLQEWFDPMQAIADAGELDFGLDMPDEMMPELAPFEEPPPSPPSPMTLLKQQLREHEIEPEFFDTSRPKQQSKRVMVASKTVTVPRTSRPTRLAKETIEEDYSGEIFERDEEMIEQEMAKQQEQQFLEMVIEEQERVDHLKQMIESAEAGEMETIEEEMLPELAEESPPSSPYRSPIKTPERPVKPVTTPPLPPSREQLMYGGTPKRVQERPIFEEELEFLASPGLPTPTPPRPPPPSSPQAPTPPSPPPRGLMMWESPPMGEGLFDQEIDESMLASPGMSPGRTLETDFMDLGTPTRLPAPFWEQPPTPTPPRPMPMPMPQPEPGFMAPLSPEIDAAALQRELRAHELAFRKAQAGGFRAGKRWVGRRSARNYQLIPISEQLDYEGSKKMYPAAKDYHVLLHKLPPAPPPGPYPSELMDVAHEGRFYHPDTLLDQPIPYEAELPPPIEPEWQLYGWRTPPRLRPRPAHEPAAPTQPFAKASHASDVLLFEEPPQGIYVPMDEDVIPLQLMEEGFGPSPPRPMQISPPRPQLSPRMMPPSPGFAIPTMTMSQQMMQATQMAQWQAERIASPPRPPSPERIPSPPRRAAPPPSPYRSPQQARQPSPPAPHWSPQPGPSSMPHIYPYAPPSPPRQPSPPMRESARQPVARPSPPRETPPPPQRPQVPSPPRITKRVTEVKYTSQFYDPDSPEASKKWTKGRTMLQFNRPCGDQRPVQTPRPQGVAVYGTGAPASGAEYPPVAPMPQMGSPERAPPRRPVRFMGREQQEGQTPKRRGGRLPRRRILEGEIDAQDRLHRRNLLSEYMGEEPQEPVPLSPPPQVSSVTAVQGERIEVMEEYVETEHDYIPEHLTRFRWMDAPDDDYYSAFKQQFRR